MTDKPDDELMRDRLLQLATMLDRDAEETLTSDGATYWYDGERYATGDKVDWAIRQWERAAALRSRAEKL